MAIVNEYPDLDALTQVPGLARSADFNTLRDAVEYLANPPYCAVKLQNAQEVATGVDHTISWDTAVDDSHGDMWDPGAPSKITMTRPGVYGFALNLLWEDANDATKRAAFLHLDGERRRGIQVPAASPAELSVYWETNVGALQETDIRVRHLAGAALDLDPLRCVMTVKWLRKPPAVGE